MAELEEPGCEVGCHENAECVNNKCRCKDGFEGDGYFDCSAQCVCRLRGDPILEDFDGGWMLLVGTKKYTMVKYMDPEDPCSFNIEVKAATPLSGAQGQTFPRFLDIMIYGVRIRLEQGHRVFVGGEEVAVPMRNIGGSDLSIFQSGNFIEVESPSCGIKAGFDGKGVESVGTVVVPPRYGDRMIGLCGNCDGELDQLRTKDGSAVQNDPEKFALVSDSFTVDESSDSGLQK